MKLSDLLRPERVLLDFEAKNKDEAIGTLVAPVVNGFEREKLLASIMEREKLGSTGVGQGVGLPHVRVEAVETPVVVFGRSVRPIPFDAIDAEPCTMFFLVLGPTRADAQEGYLQVMAKISRLMRNAEMREALASAKTPEALIEAVRGNES